MKLGFEIIALLIKVHFSQKKTRTIVLSFLELAGHAKKVPAYLRIMKVYHPPDFHNENQHPSLYS